MISKIDYRQKNKKLENSFYIPNTKENEESLYNDFLVHSNLYKTNFDGSNNNEKNKENGDVVNNEKTNINEILTHEVDVPITMNRSIKVLELKNKKYKSKTCYVSFKFLCETDRGASDYHAICKYYDTIFLYGKSYYYYFFLYILFFYSFFTFFSN